jgi:hypothetical protein
MQTEFWIVDVKEERDLELGLPGYHQRFKVTGDDAADRAWAIWAEAVRCGFLASAERVKPVKVGVEV